jgi:hypothetical protein
VTAALVARLSWLDRVCRTAGAPYSLRHRLRVALDYLARRSER